MFCMQLWSSFPLNSKKSVLHKSGDPPSRKPYTNSELREMMTSSSPLDPADPTQEDQKVLALFDKLLEENRERDIYSDSSLLSGSLFPLLGHGFFDESSDSDFSHIQPSSVDGGWSMDGDDEDDGQEDYDHSDPNAIVDFWTAYGDSDDWDMYSSSENGSVDERASRRRNREGDEEEVSFSGETFRRMRTSDRLAARRRAMREAAEILEEATAGTAEERARMGGEGEGSREVNGEEQNGSESVGAERVEGGVANEELKRDDSVSRCHEPDISTTGDLNGRDTKAKGDTQDTNANTSDLARQKEVASGSSCVGRAVKRKATNSASEVAAEATPGASCVIGEAAKEGACSVSGGGHCSEDCTDDTSSPKAKSKRQRLVELNSGTADFSHYSLEDFLKPKPASFYSNSDTPKKQ